MTVSLRHIVTPAVACLALICAITGVALFFHLKPHWFHTAHEWLGFPFIIVGVWHAVRHGASLSAYTKRPGSVRFTIALLLFGLLFIGATASPERGNPQAILVALEHAPLAKVADLLGQSPEVAREKLHHAGITATDTQRIDEIAQAAQLPARRILSLLSTDPS